MIKSEWVKWEVSDSVDHLELDGYEDIRLIEEGEMYHTLTALNHFGEEVVIKFNDSFEGFVTMEVNYKQLPTEVWEIMNPDIYNSYGDDSDILIKTLQRNEGKRIEIELYNGLSLIYSYGNLENVKVTEDNILFTIDKTQLSLRKDSISSVNLNSLINECDYRVVTIKAM